MVRRFFLDKCNTIIKNSPVNIGLSPVLELNYGKGVSRGLLHFNLDEIYQLVKDKVFADNSKVTYRLKMTNCASIDPKAFFRYIGFGIGDKKRRASSFDLVLFALKENFDQGRGYECEKDFYKDERAYAEDGATWYQSKNGRPWKRGDGAIDAEGFDLRGLCDGFEDGSMPDNDILIGMQHFDYGDENLDIDVTAYVNKMLERAEAVENNYGLGLAFVPRLENMVKETYEYVGFFTDQTNTIFHPYIEATYDEVIDDDRRTFFLGKENRLYLYCNVGGRFENLDELPTCEIEGQSYDVEQATKGVYYVTVPADCGFKENTILEDTWSNIKYQGKELSDVVMEFVPLPENMFFNFGSEIHENKVVPVIYGINNDERVRQGEIRKLIVDFRKEYTTNKRLITQDAAYRLYTKDGNREIDILGGYQPIEKMFLENYFNIYTEDLIPSQYHIDIRVRYNNELLIRKDILTFEIVSDVTERRV